MKSQKSNLLVALLSIIFSIFFATNEVKAQEEYRINGYEVAILGTQTLTKVTIKIRVNPSQYGLGETIELIAKLNSYGDWQSASGRVEKVNSYDKMAGQFSHKVGGGYGNSFIYFNF